MCGKDKHRGPQIPASKFAVDHRSKYRTFEKTPQKLECSVNLDDGESYSTHSRQHSSATISHEAAGKIEEWKLDRTYVPWVQRNCTMSRFWCEQRLFHLRQVARRLQYPVALYYPVSFTLRKEYSRMFVKFSYNYSFISLSAMCDVHFSNRDRLQRGRSPNDCLPQAG